jgi:hypothetical protein
MQVLDLGQRAGWRAYLKEGGRYRLLQSFVGVCFVTCQGYLLPLIFPLGVLQTLVRNPLWICSGVLLVTSMGVLDYMEFEVVKHPDYIPTPKLDPLRRQTVIPALYSGFYGRDIVFILWKYGFIAIGATALIAMARWFVGLPVYTAR